MKFVLLALAATLPLTVPAAAQAPGMISLKDLRAKYGDSGSRYVTIDGAEIHYRDEGQGPVVVMLHASYFNTLSWKPLSEALRANYRVIRIDFPNVGLSGPETKEPPGGKFNLIERNFDVLAGLADALKLDRFALIATSSGGSVGFRYASRNPARVTRLVLINSAGMPRTAQTDPNRERSDTAQWDAMPIKPREFWAYSVGKNFPSTKGAPDWFVDMAYDFNRRGDTTPASKYQFATGDPKAILSGITAPTLIMWGMDNPTVVHLEADVIEHWLTGAPSMIKKYEGLGHYPYVEAPDRLIPDIRAFLSGTLDQDLRQTQRVKVGK
jgi:pimeloyl-ACP methyl ester carboxylesterase